MSTIAAQRRPAPPGDEDLQNLYNQVWAGFAEESPAVDQSSSTAVPPPAAQCEAIESLYSAYGIGDDAHADIPRSKVVQVSPSAPSRSSSATAVSNPNSIASPASPRDRPLPNPFPTPTTPNSGRPHRKLPPLPVGSPSTSISSAMNVPGMSESKAYSTPEQGPSNPQRPKHASAESTPQSRRPPAMTLNGNGVVPNGSSRHRPATSEGSTERTRLPGLPSTPRPSYGSPPQQLPARPDSSSSGTRSSESPTSNPSPRQSNYNHSAYPMPVPEIPAAEDMAYGGSSLWDGRIGTSSPPSRQPSARPPGAQAPQMPSYAGYPVRDTAMPVAPPLPPPPPPPDVYARLAGTTSPSAGYYDTPADISLRAQSPSYFPQNSALQNPSLQNPPPRSSSRANVEPGTPLRASYDNPRVIQPQQTLQHRPSASVLSANSSYASTATSEQLGRSASIGSSALSYGTADSMNRKPSLTSASSMTFSSADKGGLARESLSAVVTLDRGNSYSSYSSHLSPTPEQQPYVRHSPSLSIQDARSMQGARATTPSYGEGGSSQRRPNNDYIRAIETMKAPLALHHDDYDDYDDEFYDGDSDSDVEDRFVNFALLSHIAVRLRDRVPRGTHVKGGIPYPRAFTGKDVVSTIQSQIQRELLINHGISTNDRRAALQVARSLQNQLFFYEVEWGGRVLQDGVEDVYMFLDDQEGASEARLEREELPTGVITMLTKCYSSGCTEERPCYAYLCPRKQRILTDEPSPEPAGSTQKEGDWQVPEEILQSLPPSEINRQTIIHKVISKEKQYVEDLDIVESLFMKPLRTADPPVVHPDRVDDFMEEVFGNILDLRECNRRLLENLYVRQREQAPVIQRIGDVFLEAATEFRLAYPIYVGHLPLAEKRMKDEMENNVEFRMFLEHSARHPDSRRIDLKHFLNRPSEHLQKYPVLLEAIHHETVEGNPDAEFLMEAIEAIKNLQTVAQLLTFQSAMGKGPTGKFEWHNLVSEEFRKSLPKKEAKRQSIIFELIKGEMAYVKDLENMEYIYIRPLRASDPSIIPLDRLDSFINDVFHNYAQLHFHHNKLLETLHDIQREQHPIIRSVAEAVLDAFLNFREAYLEYVPNYPIAAYRIDEEMNNNALFKAFVEQCVRHPDAHRLDMKSFINRPIPRLLRYELLFKSILDETPLDHEDQAVIHQLLEVIKALGKETEPGVASAKQKVELWRYNTHLVFKIGETVDMDLLNENRSLIHTGRLLRQPDTGFEWNGWTELFVLLFDNYLVMTKPKEKDGVTKYNVNRRPIPLDLLTLVNFTDPPTQRGTGFIGFKRGERHPDQPAPPPGSAINSADSSGDARAVYPCTLHYNGRMGGLYTLFAESAQVRTEWKQKLDEAIGLRKVVQESNKVFEIETLSTDTFLVPSMLAGPMNPSWNNENSFTGKVTCSVPFTTPDGRALVAVGCAEGVWIGFRHDSRSMRRVLHLKMVSQCAMLEDFGIFLVLADRSLFAYHIEALVPSSLQNAHTSQTPQKLSKNSENVHFFSVGNLGGRTLVVYMKKNRLDNVFRVLEPVVDNINDRNRTPATLGTRLGFRAQRSEWFRVYRDFFLPSETFDLIFLKAKIAILCTKGFEIMDLTDFRSATVPQRDDPKQERLAKRCDACKPVGMFRSNEDEFLLCYDEFGVYVDRHGDPSRPTVGIIDWEGTAERAAWHEPYVLLFDTRFIEVRHVETGRLVQIIPGNDLRCIWDGRGSSTNMNLATPGPDGWQENGLNQEARVHGVMNAPEVPPKNGSNVRPSKAIAQHVFELVPTVPLYLPESLASPSASTYFPQSNSPPRSPRLNSSGSWR